MAGTAPLSLSGLEDDDLADVLAQLARFDDDLRGARVLVTGATGWFGTWLLDALVALDRTRRLGLRIVAASRDPQAFAARHPALHRAPQIEWITADVRRLFTVEGRITHVIHAATDASARLNADDPDRMYDTIVSGTRHVLDVAARASAARLLFVGSGAVYGVQPAGVSAFSEDHVVAPALRDTGNAYAEGKRAAERLILAWQQAGHGTASIARCFAFTGPHMPFDAHFAIGNFVRDALEREALVVRGDGRPLRSYLYMGDLVVWLLTILLAGRAGRAYNVGSDDAVSIATLAQRCVASTGRAVDVVVEGRPGDARDYVPVIDRARDELGLAVRVPLDAAIDRTVAWRRRTVMPEAVS